MLVKFAKSRWGWLMIACSAALRSSDGFEGSCCVENGKGEGKGENGASEPPPFPGRERWSISESPVYGIRVSYRISHALSCKIVWSTSKLVQIPNQISPGADHPGEDLGAGRVKPPRATSGCGTIAICSATSTVLVGSKGLTLVFASNVRNRCSCLLGTCPPLTVALVKSLP
ncbi:unnamed protein product [Tuber aestivum]|uniref:Secreted protein n=1 Tax=Tuber aestivum TaxID=59557 RepID=A0A292Q6F3_9PEZI|nr:unnamed protein product [Tuber aestivum]